MYVHLTSSLLNHFTNLCFHSSVFSLICTFLCIYSYSYFASCAILCWWQWTLITSDQHIGEHWFLTRPVMFTYASVLNDYILPATKSSQLSFSNIHIQLLSPASYNYHTNSLYSSLLCTSILNQTIVSSFLFGMA